MFRSEVPRVSARGYSEQRKIARPACPGMWILGRTGVPEEVCQNVRRLINDPENSVWREKPECAVFHAREHDARQGLGGEETLKPPSCKAGSRSSPEAEDATFRQSGVPVDVESARSVGFIPPVNSARPS
jgi:hypothetical protein